MAVIAWLVAAWALFGWSRALRVVARLEQLLDRQRKFYDAYFDQLAEQRALELAEQRALAELERLRSTEHH